MFGQGLLKGLQITLQELFTKKVTVQYPEESLPLAPRFHGEFVLDVEQCIACSLCANACPNKVIEIETAKLDKKRVLTGYMMRLQYCLFCGLCVEACNKGAIRFSQKFEMAKYFRDQIPLILYKGEPPVQEEQGNTGITAGEAEGTEV
ncbi:MAG: NADH-quinone oxidoreductase subunit I [Peptococcaceae bacterium]|jgi:NADH-quinone oxidoreductase subunit I|nr:MAG: NADH-quinone oxidoreductase subunit I [Peptococcaceae bacterium]